MDFTDRLLTCSDCGEKFVFTAGEQLFFFDKQFKNDPKRCKPCKGKRLGPSARPGTASALTGTLRIETRTECSACGIDTTVPFKPTQGRPVLCRQCFQRRQIPQVATPVAQSSAVAQMNSATAELIAAASGKEQLSVAAGEMLAAPARA